VGQEKSRLGGGAGKKNHTKRELVPEQPEEEGTYVTADKLNAKLALLGKARIEAPKGAARYGRGKPEAPHRLRNGKGGSWGPPSGVETTTQRKNHC